MITVYRIEDSKTGKGAWRSLNKEGQSKINTYWFGRAAKNLHNDLDTPEDDHRLVEYFDKNYYCAFRQKEDFKIWFRRAWLRHLYKNGFRFLELTLKSDYHHGRDQVIFKKSGIVETKDISEQILNDLYI